MPDSNRTSDKWIEYMQNGAFEKAWMLSDEVLKNGTNREYHSLARNFQCIWDGTPLKGKRVLIRCYHGLGDTIQFIRYVRLLKEVAAQVIVWAQPKLIELLETFSGIDKLIPIHDGPPDTDYDVDVEILELPHIFRTSLYTIPLNIPYLNVNPVSLVKDKGQLSVGLVWHAGDWDPSRCIPFLSLMPLAFVKGVEYCILQNNALSAGWRPGFGIHPGECSIYEYAEIISGLDLMITVDSMPAHLAGALNVPVWVMLKIDSDWRWMINRTDSPWYPSMKLFRQTTSGNWDNVINQVARELSAFQIKRLESSEFSANLR